MTQKHDKNEFTSPEDEVVQVVFEDGKAYHYNANNTLVNTTDNEMPNFKDLIALYAKKAKADLHWQKPH